MIFELSSSTEFIRVTSEYSNAVLVALMPLFSEFAQKVEVPIRHPITIAQVEQASILPWRMKDGSIGGGGIRIKGGWSFGFQFGYVNSFEGPHSYYGLQNPDEIPNFYGNVNMSKYEAIQLARHTITKLGIPLESVFAEQEPHVKEPTKIGTNTVPHYQVEWLDLFGGSTVRMDVDGNSKTVQAISFSSRNLQRASPKVNVLAPRTQNWPPTNIEYAKKFVPIVTRAIDEYGKKLALPVPRPLTTNHITRFSLSDNGGWPHAEIELTNGWRFIYRNSMVNGYYAPDNLFNSDQRPILIKDFVGKWNVSEEEAIKLVKRTLAKLNYPTNLVHMDFKPEVIKPKLPGIPRCAFWWNLENAAKDDLQSKVEAEVDMEKGELKSLYYDDKAYWNKPPPIDVPLTLPSSTQTNASPTRHNIKPSEKAPKRNWPVFPAK